MSVNACKAEKVNGGPIVYRCDTKDARECAWSVPMPGLPRTCALARFGKCTQPTANRAALIVALEPHHIADVSKMVGQ
jgi:hypothetical protein